MKKVILFFGLCINAITVLAQQQALLVQPIFLDTAARVDDPFLRPLKLKSDKRLNFYVITREKSKKLDYTTLTVSIRAFIREFLDRKKLFIIVAKSSEDAARRIARIVQDKGMLIENIWFDSHGHYKNRMSSFRVGHDVFSFTNINDSNANKYLRYIAGYCDAKTRIALGACYAGADFSFPATDSLPATRMNGDSLMIGLGNIFAGSSIYASESWVMAKPGIFANKYGFAGYPLNKRSLDVIFKPVWERIGKWKQYNSITGTVSSSSTVSLSRAGNINVRMKDYNVGKKARKAIAKKLQKLRPGLAFREK